MPKPLDKQVGHQSSMASISVGKWVDRYEPVMKANSEFIRFICCMFQPVQHVVKLRCNLGRDEMRFDANIAFPHPVFACSTPDVTEHLLMQRLGVLVVQDICGLGASTSARPSRPAQYILRLSPIEVGAIGDPSLQ
ncbi:hypothetical protein V1281_006362 [Nitrobacteraceae bacterium AZCC 2161]